MFFHAVRKQCLYVKALKCAFANTERDAKYFSTTWEEKSKENIRLEEKNNIP